jgi:curved DNA-binding protein CbpA
LQDYVLLAQLDFFALLGVSLSSSSKEVQRAYHAQAKRYHPDSFGPSQPSEVRQRAAEIFLRVRKAYEALATEEGRNSYRQVLELAKDSHSAPHRSLERAQDTARRHIAVSAELAFREGKVAVELGQFAAALPRLRQALSERPTEPSYLSHYGWALYQLDKAQNRVVGIEQIDLARELDPACAIAQQFRGLIALDDGQEHMALRCFKAATCADPGLEVAREWVHVLTVRIASRETSTSRPDTGLFRLIEAYVENRPLPSSSRKK